jgi:Chromate transporter
MMTSGIDFSGSPGRITSATHGEAEIEERSGSAARRVYRATPAGARARWRQAQGALGTVMGPAPNGWTGGLICLGAIFLPSFLLLIGVLPFWDTLRRRPVVQSALRGVNAAVVGLLLAALYKPVWTSAILAPADFAIGIVAFLLLALWAVPPWVVVILGAAAATVVAGIP